MAICEVCETEVAAELICFSCQGTHAICAGCRETHDCTTQVGPSSTDLLVEKKRKRKDSDSGSLPDLTATRETETKKVKLSVAKGKKGNVSQAPDYESLTLLHLDVDQGACTLVLYTYTDGRRWTAVIDGGHGNPGRGQIVRYLNALKIAPIDYLFLSHYDADHADGVAHLILHHGPGSLDPIVNRQTTLCVPYINQAQPPVKYAQSHGLTVVAGSLGRLINIGAFSVDVVAANNGGDENTRSLALLISLGEFKYLTCGDLPTEYEDAVAQRVGRVDVLYCSHHGSAYSTSANTLRSLGGPPIAVISAGRNPFGHPNSETLARFPMDSSIFRAYLTGCQFNRKFINPNYYATEQANLHSALDSAEQQFNLTFVPETVKNLAAAITDILEYFVEEGFSKSDFDPTVAKEEIKKTVQRLAGKDDIGADTKAKLFFLEVVRVCRPLIDECTDSRSGSTLPVIAHVSGARNEMGPVGIRVRPDGNVVDVGFHQENGWSWRHKWSRADGRLKQTLETEEFDGAIQDAIPDIPKVTDSPGKFKGWAAVRSSERQLYSLSSRTPRKPIINVDYKCRWCPKSGSEDMVLVVCEHCQANGWVIAYHAKCLEEAATGVRKGDKGYRDGAKYPLWPQLKELLNSAESKETPVLIPAHWEACHCCGTFRPSDYVAFSRRNTARGVGQERERRVAGQIELRRQQYENDELTKVANPDDGDWPSLGWDTFGEFYEAQREMTESSEDEQSILF